MPHVCLYYYTRNCVKIWADLILSVGSCNRQRVVKVKIISRSGMHITLPGIGGGMDREQSSDERY